MCELFGTLPSKLGVVEQTRYSYLLSRNTAILRRANAPIAHYSTSLSMTVLGKVAIRRDCADQQDTSLRLDDDTYESATGGYIALCFQRQLHACWVNALVVVLRVGL